MKLEKQLKGIFILIKLTFINRTKKYYLWQFVLNGHFHKIELYHSKMSSKKRLCVDSKIIYEEKSYISNLKHKFKNGEI